MSIREYTKWILSLCSRKNHTVMLPFACHDLYGCSGCWRTICIESSYTWSYLAIPPFSSPSQSLGTRSLQNLFHHGCLDSFLRHSFSGSWLAFFSCNSRSWGRKPLFLPKPRYPSRSTCICGAAFCTHIFQYHPTIVLILDTHGT